MTAPVLVDDAVRRRIAVDGLDELLFVEAGAGTGKTKQLVDRVVSLVVARGIPMREIAAITFTEAAASELRSRIREAFERSVHSTTAGDVERARSEAALADLDSAAIGTVHSFAQRILAEHPVEAGLPPSVEVLDEVESLLEFGRRWRDQIDRMFATPELQPVITLARLLHVHLDRDRLPSLREVAAVFADNWDRLDALLATPVFEPRIERADAQAALAGLADVLARGAEIPEDKLAERLLGYAEDMDAMALALADGSDRTVIRRIAAKRNSKKRWGHKGAGQAANWGGKDEKTAAAAQVAAAEDALDELFDRATDDVLRVLAGEVARFTVRAAEERLADGQARVPRPARLRSPVAAHECRRARALHDRYTRLLVDEFQDTDPIQVELATLIAATVGEYRPAAIGPRCRSTRSACSSWVTRSSRSTASGAPTSSCSSRHEIASPASRCG